MRPDLGRVKSDKPTAYLYSICKACGRKLMPSQRTSLGFNGEVCRMLDMCSNVEKNQELRKLFRRR